ncbi:cytochrome P450 6k1-like [Trichogramma pretiosum]|uniref:cytochrome P450 6k1-like n=1 Tax=Trichogramma pretiosum TaxID=7493 RepID=UPI000C718983|nr:cytochrome P450 6k1-like [Trichogramma pretiosum]
MGDMLSALFSFSNVVTILATGFVLFYLYAKYKQSYWRRRGVDSPPAHWFFGNFKDAICLRSAPPAVLGEIYKYYQGQPDKPVIGLYIMQTPFLLLRSPEVIKQVFIKDFHNFTDRYFAAKRKTDVIGSTGLFSIDNPEWKYLRVKLSPAFTSGKQKKLFELMVESAKNLNQYMAKKVGEGKIDMEVRRVCAKYTTDVISSLTFGIRTNSFDEPEPEFFVRSRDIFKQDLRRTLNLFVAFFFPKLGDYLQATFLGKHEEYFRKIFWESVNAREKSGFKRGDLIDFLVELKNEPQDAQFRFDGDQLLAQSAIFFVAGLETSAITMTFTLMELARHPEIQKKVRDEIREKIGKATLTYDMISQMSYLQQVVSEILRLYPPAPLLDRVALNDYKVPGTDIVIEKGTVVYTTLMGIHEDPGLHPDPTKFDPDRFSEERKDNIQPCTYMPFGDGPRICIGQRTGQLQTMVGLITILRDYEVSQNTNYKNEVSKRAIFLAPADGVHIYVKKNPVL